MSDRSVAGSRIVIRFLGFGAGLYLLYVRVSARDWLDAAIVGLLMVLWALEILHRRNRHS
jgi:hypothetical protein